MFLKIERMSQREFTQKGQFEQNFYNLLVQVIDVCHSVDELMRMMRTKGSTKNVAIKVASARETV